jgi:hypothetical protein
MQWSSHLVYPGDERCVCCGGHLPRGQSICTGCRSVIRRAPDLFRLVERLVRPEGDPAGLVKEAGELVAEIAARRGTGTALAAA